MVLHLSIILGQDPEIFELPGLGQGAQIFLLCLRAPHPPHLHKAEMQSSGPPKSNKLLALAASPDPVHENQKQDRRQIAALVESNTNKENAENTENNANKALTVFIHGTNNP